MTTLLFPLLISALCIAGLYVALSMQGKANRYARGAIAEPSVVQRPAARIFLGIPNSAFGTAFYVLLLGAAWFLQTPAVYYTALGAASAAAGLSIYLAYSLLFLTRMPCPYCWTGHIVNWSLLALLILARPSPH